jgi:hypothetical protein
MARVLDRSDVYPLSDKQREVVAHARDRLAAMLKRGKVSSGERTWLVWTARLLMVSIF